MIGWWWWTVVPSVASSSTHKQPWRPQYLAEKLLFCWMYLIEEQLQTRLLQDSLVVVHDRR